MNEISSYIIKNRLNNIMSKTGEVSFKWKGKLLGLFSKNSLKDFLKDNQSDYGNLEKNEQNTIHKFVIIEYTAQLNVCFK